MYIPVYDPPIFPSRIWTYPGGSFGAVRLTAARLISLCVVLLQNRLKAQYSLYFFGPTTTRIRLLNPSAVPSSAIRIGLALEAKRFHTDVNPSGKGDFIKNATVIVNDSGQEMCHASSASKDLIDLSKDREGVGWLCWQAKKIQSKIRGQWRKDCAELKADSMTPFRAARGGEGVALNQHSVTASGSRSISFCEFQFPLSCCRH